MIILIALCSSLGRVQSDDAQEENEQHDFFFDDIVPISQGIEFEAFFESKSGDRERRDIEIGDTLPADISSISAEVGFVQTPILKNTPEFNLLEKFSVC